MKRRLALLVVTVAAILTGCSTDTGVDNPKGASPNFTNVEVFFATDRKAASNDDPYEAFSAEAAETTAYGACRVSIPRDHRMGAVEASFLNRRWLEDPDTDVVLHSAERLDAGAFFKRSDRDSAFVFVHGFNVSFGDAAKRTAQMAYDLGFRGAPMFFSWPSHGAFSPGAYHEDEAASVASAGHLETFLEDYLARTRVRSLYLIAHSMGNRPMTRAVTGLLRKHPEYRGRIREIILTAPDMDESVFGSEIAPAFAGDATGHRTPVTLYVSSHDRALGFATDLMDGVRRLGDANRGIPVYPGIRTIDASAVDTSFSGHCYYAENRSVLCDIFYLLRQDPDDRFGMRSQRSEAGEYWTFRP